MEKDKILSALPFAIQSDLDLFPFEIASVRL